MLQFIIFQNKENNWSNEFESEYIIKNSKILTNFFVYSQQQFDYKR